MSMLIHYCSISFEQSDWPTRILVMLSQQDQEMRRNVPDPSFAGGSHFCGSGAGNEGGRAVGTCTVVPGGAKFCNIKWRFLSNVLARVGKTGEMVANCNSKSWIGLFQGAKCDNVPKWNLEFA